MTDGGFVYVASPYSHESADVRRDRFEAACRYTARLLLDGVSAFSPIAHSHPIADHMPGDRRLDHDLWMSVDLPVLRYASEVHVLTLSGWRESRGVQREIERAALLGVRVLYVVP